MLTQRLAKGGSEQWQAEAVQQLLGVPREEVVGRSYTLSSGSPLPLPSARGILAGQGGPRASHALGTHI